MGLSRFILLSLISICTSDGIKSQSYSTGSPEKLVSRSTSFNIISDINLCVIGGCGLMSFWKSHDVTSGNSLSSAGTNDRLGRLGSIKTLGDKSSGSFWAPISYSTMWRLRSLTYNSFRRILNQ